MDNASVKNTLETIYKIDELFYGYPDKADWPESAKLFYSRMITVFGKVVISSGIKPEELKRILEEEI